MVGSVMRVNPELGQFSGPGNLITAPALGYLSCQVSERARLSLCRSAYCFQISLLGHQVPPAQVASLASLFLISLL